MFPVVTIRNVHTLLKGHVGFISCFLYEHRHILSIYQVSVASRCLQKEHGCDGPNRDLSMCS